MQDHKAVGEGDVGPNTGGMGAYSPAPAVTHKMEQQVMQDIVQRTADALVAEGCPYRGVLFAGLMIKDGKVICCNIPPVALSACASHALPVPGLYLSQAYTAVVIL